MIRPVHSGDTATDSEGRYPASYSSTYYYTSAGTFPP